MEMLAIDVAAEDKNGAAVTLKRKLTKAEIKEKIQVEIQKVVQPGLVGIAK